MLPLFLAFALHSPSPQASPQRIELGGGPLGVLTDVDAGGAVWARSARYKARFDAAGVLVKPVVGRAAPGASLSFALAGATVDGLPLALDLGAAPALGGDTVVYERGGLREVYRLAPGEVEQVFVVDELPARGALELRLDLLGDTPARRIAAEAPRGAGFAFGTPSKPGVACSGAWTRDAAGAEVATDAALEDGELVLRLPADFVARAVLPLVIDPILQPIGVDPSANDARDPDVGYDAAGGGVFLVVYEDATDAGDVDVLSRRYSDAGVLLDEVAVDVSTASSVDPAVAGGGGELLVAWADEPSGPAQMTRIRARRRTAATDAQGPAIPIAVKLFGDVRTPAVGGPASGVALGDFLVAWEEDGDVLLARVDPNSAVLPGPFAATATLETAPAITPVPRADGAWLVVHERREPDGTGSVLVHRAFTSGGGFVGAPYVAETQLPDEGAFARVATEGDTFLVTTSRLGLGGIDVQAQRVGVTDAPFPVVGVNASLILGLEAGAERRPAIGFDGVRYLLAYESGGAFLGGDVSAVVFLDLFGPVFEHPTLAAAPGTAEEGAALAMTRGEHPGLALVAWEEGKPSGFDVAGALLSTLAPGGVDVVQTGCGAPEPVLATSSVPAIGSTFEAALQGLTVTGTGVILFGLPATVPLCPTQGGCVLGVQPIVTVVPAAVLTATIPFDPALVGGVVALQGADLFPVGPGGACSPPLVPIPLRLTDTLRLTLQ